MSQKLRKLLFLPLLSLAFWAPLSQAQNARGTITGTTKDPGGSILRGALAELPSLQKRVPSDDNGQFTFPDVPAGDYEMKVSYIGFAPLTLPVKVTGGQTTKIDAVLQLASQSEQVLVTATRVQGEAEAINIERTSDNLVQVLPSNVIQSLPNTNIADAVGRLPSVTLERDEGEGKYVQIRGTEPRLSNVTINGVHVPSPEGNVRNIKLDIVPADLVDRIEVSKTLLPNQDADAIGGSVNLVTKTPSEKTVFSAEALGGYTPIQDGRTQDLFSGTIGRRFLDEGKLGVLVGGSFDHNNRGIDDLEPTQAIGTNPADNSSFAYINSEDRRTYKYDRSRFGFDGSIDYNVKPGWTTYLRGLYSDFYDYGSTFVSTPNAGGIVSHSGSQTVFDNTGNLQYREYIRRPDQGVFSVETGATHAISTTIVHYQFAISRGHNNGGQDFATTYFNGLQNVQFNLNENDPRRPILTPGDGSNYLDPTTYSIASTVLPTYRSTELDYQGDAYLAKSYSLGSHESTFQAGIQIRNAYKTQNENDRFFDATGNFTMDQVLSKTTNSNYYDHTYQMGPLTDYGKIQALVNGQLQTGFTENTDKNRIVSDPATWNANERIYAGYLMDSITFGKLRLEGGLRIEATSEQFHANQVTLNNGAYQSTTPIKGSTDYVNFDPSIQAQYQLASNTDLRLSYYRALSRPNFQDIVPAVQADPNTSPKSLQVGNPALQPTKANNYDVLIEHYFQPLGILQGGFFYKSLSDPIYPTVSFVAASDPNFPGYLRQESINGPSAYIAGFEMAWQQRLSFLPGLLNGFGVSANYSYATSRVTFPQGFSSAVKGGQGRIDHPALQRQAPNTWNLGFTYDKKRFSMRFGVSHNDANIYAYGYVHDPTAPGIDKDPILGIKGPLGDQYLYAHTQFDVQGSYRIYRGMEVIGQGLNLSNEVFGFYTGSPIYPNQREYYHPSAIFGVRWISSSER